MRPVVVTEGGRRAGRLLLLTGFLILGVLGPGKYSLDRALGIDDDLDGWRGGGIALLGVLGALAMLAACWRPEKPES